MPCFPLRVGMACACFTHYMENILEHNSQKGTLNIEHISFTSVFISRRFHCNRLPIEISSHSEESEKAISYNLLCRFIHIVAFLIFYFLPLYTLCTERCSLFVTGPQCHVIGLSIPSPLFNLFHSSCSVAVNPLLLL